MRTSQKKLAASEKCTAEPPSMRSRSPNGVLTESYAIEPTTTRAMTGTGGYAQYATAREETTFPLPDEVDDGQALALLIQGLTAWHLYRTCARILPGESVVVHSAAGGVGSIAVQLGKPMGAGRVIATASSEEKRAF